MRAVDRLCSPSSQRAPADMHTEVMRRRRDDGGGGGTGGERQTNEAEVKQKRSGRRSLG